jgi:hypothetical protein
VRVGSKFKSLAMAAVVLVVGAGCGGFNATPAFSPLMFFFPGLADARLTPRQTPPQPTPVGSNGDLAQLN